MIGIVNSMSRLLRVVRQVANDELRVHTSSVAPSYGEKASVKLSRLPFEKKLPSMTAMVANIQKLI